MKLPNINSLLKIELILFEASRLYPNKLVPVYNWIIPSSNKKIYNIKKLVNKILNDKLLFKKNLIKNKNIMNLK